MVAPDLPGGHWLAGVALRVLQECYRGVTEVSKECYTCVRRVEQEWYKGVTGGCEAEVHLLKDLGKKRKVQREMTKVQREITKVQHKVANIIRIQQSKRG